MANVRQVQCLYTYYPRHGRDYAATDEFSRMILNLKDNRPDAIDYFTYILSRTLSREEYVICLMPSHALGGAREGIATLARRLCLGPVRDGADVLLRKVELPKKSAGGERNLLHEIKSLAVQDKDLIRGQQVLLVDDVTTTGVSLFAGRYALEVEGASLVAMFALGRTDSKR
jgi:predicted amidophosphoribosyltransferase